MQVCLSSHQHVISAFILSCEVWWLSFTETTSPDYCRWELKLKSESCLIPCGLCSQELNVSFSAVILTKIPLKSVANECYITGNVKICKSKLLWRVFLSEGLMGSELNSTVVSNVGKSVVLFLQPTTQTSVQVFIFHRPDITQRQKLKRDTKMF